MRARKYLKGLGYVLAALIALRLGLVLVWPTINDVQTGATPEYADLQPQRFNQDFARVFESALATARAAGWEISAQDAAKGEIQAVATTALWKFKDDVSITLSRSGAEVVVNLRSRSRIGKGDLGANARRIRAYQAELARALGQP